MKRWPPLALPGLAALMLLACATAPSPPLGGSPAPAADPWTLRPPSAWPGDRVWRQTLTARFGERTQTIDAVLQKQGDTLTVVGLTPFGSKAFVLQQRGLEVSFRSFTDRELPFAPTYILVDIQRAYFPSGLEAPPDGEASSGLEAPPDGEVSAPLGAETLHERRSGGLLVGRRYVQANAPAAATVTVAYADWSGDIPTRVTLANARLGYVLEITTSALAAP